MLALPDIACRWTIASSSLQQHRLPCGTARYARFHTHLVGLLIRVARDARFRWPVEFFAAYEMFLDRVLENFGTPIH